jgi:DNA-directed RNA polymerase specialized sigma24 family protein
VQEVFVQLFRHLARFRREAELSTWLYRICISQARSVSRRKRLSHALSQLLSCAAAAHTRVDAVVARRGRAPQGRGCAQPSLRRRSHRLRAVRNGRLPGKRIAEIVDSHEASVWRRLHDARRVFRRALEAEVPELYRVRP